MYNKLNSEMEVFMMKKIIGFALLVCLVVPVHATYYEITSGHGTLGMENSDTLLMTGGGLAILTMFDSSSATITGTSTLSQGFGGIWEIDLAGNSHLDMGGGQVNEIDIGSNATASLRGGLIESIYSYQATTKTEGDPPQQVPNPHITLYYSGDIPTVQEISSFNYLVGNWGDGTGFSIYLHDTGYDAYANFDFILIPEPATLLLIGLGGFLIRRKK